MTRWLPRTASYGVAALLSSGNVVLFADLRVPTSKYSSPNVTAVYDPKDDRWSTYQPLPASVYRAPSLALLASGKLIITGGAASCGSTCIPIARPNVWELDSLL